MAKSMSIFSVLLGSGIGSLTDPILFSSDVDVHALGSDEALSSLRPGGADTLFSLSLG